MPSASKRIQKLAPSEITRLFQQDDCLNSTSQNAEHLLKAFRKRIETRDFPEDQMAEANTFCDTLEQVYRTRFDRLLKRSGSTDPQLSPPSGLAWTPNGDLVVADDFNHRIQIYDAAGKLKSQFGAKGKNPGEFSYPKGLAVDSEGHLYVADSWNHRIQKLDLTGKVIQVIGEYGEGPGQLNEPYDVLVEASGRLIVIERYNHRIQFFNPAGHSLGWTGSRATVFEDQLAYLYETAEAQLPRPALEFPTSIAEDSNGYFYITDSANHRILKFNSEWQPIASFGEQGSGPRQFQYPMSVTTDATGKLYVADLNNDRIQVLTTEGLFVEAFSTVDSKTNLKMPGILLAGKNNELWVALTLDPSLYCFETSSNPSKETYTQLLQLQPESIATRLAFTQHLVEEIDTPTATTACEETIRLWLESDNTKEDAIELPQIFSKIVDSDSATTQKILNRIVKDHDERRQNLLNLFQEWIAFLPELCQQSVEEQSRIIDQKDDPVAFDKTLFDLNKQDRQWFHRSRSTMHDYRTSVFRLEETVRNFLNQDQDDTSVDQLIQHIESGYITIAETLVDLLKQKEENEEALVGLLQGEDGAQQQWPQFVTRHAVNAKIMEQIRQLLTEFLACLRLLDTATKRFPQHPLCQQALKSLLIEGPASALFGKILLGLQENMDLAAHLQGILMSHIDTLAVQMDTDAYSSFPSETIDLSPYKFDTDVMTAEELIASFRVGGFPVEIQTDSISVGGQTYPLSLIQGREAEVVAQLEKTLAYQDIYDQKTDELFQQVRELRLQKNQMEARMPHLDVRDKITPIQIGNNVRVLDFQISLLQRMILTLGINELHNQVRLVVGSTLLSAVNDAHPSIGKFFDQIRPKFQEDEKRLRNFQKEWKSLSLFNTELQGRYFTSTQQLEVNDVKAMETLQQQVVESGFNYLQKTEQVYRQARLNGLWKKLSPHLSSDTPPQLTSLKFKAYVGSVANAKSAFLFPFGVAHLENGDLLVSDYHHHAVLRFSADGVFQNRFGRFGNGPGTLNQPFGLAVGPDQTIYVADLGNRRIQAFDAKGQFVCSIGNSGPDEQRLVEFYGLAVDTNGNLWVPDTAQHCIQVFSSQGKFLRSFGEGSLNHPVSLCCLDDGGAVVSDRSDKIIQRFDSEGQLAATLKAGDHAVGESYSMVYHRDHGLLVSDTYHCRILCLNLDLEIQWVHGITGRRGGQFLRTGGLSTNAGQLFVADYDNIRVQVLDLPKP